jgi:hypothetical protein
LKQAFISHGFKDKQSLLLSRYLIESASKKPSHFSEDLSATQSIVATRLTTFVGPFKLFTDITKKLTDKAKTLLAPCKDTLKETLQLEDYEEEGIISLPGFKEALQALSLDDDPELTDYLLYVMYASPKPGEAPSLDRLRYGAIFELLAEPQRKRPESSSPEKLKARNSKTLEQ